jgi:hypothetical protein
MTRCAICGVEGTPENMEEFEGVLLHSKHIAHWRDADELLRAENTDPEDKALHGVARAPQGKHSSGHGRAMHSEAEYKGWEDKK